MRTIFVDSEFKCHLSDDGTMTAIETVVFDGKCDAFIEGHRIVPHDKVWVREDGEEFTNMVAPWKDFDELDAAQREYERQMLKEYEALIDELYSEVTE